MTEPHDGLDPLSKVREIERRVLDIREETRAKLLLLMSEEKSEERTKLEEQYKTFDIVLEIIKIVKDEQ